MIRVTFDNSGEEQPPAPTTQETLFGFGECIAKQRDLFDCPPERKPARRVEPGSPLFGD